MVDDCSLLGLWRGGDRAAGIALFDRYYASIARFFQNKVVDGAAVDLIQATFLACVEGRDRIQSDGEFRSYLFAVAHNMLRKHFREKGSHRGASVDFEEISVADLGPSSSQIIAARQEHRLLLEALRRIPVECQVVLELFYWEQMATAEMATILVVPEGTVKSRLQRGRKLLEQQLHRLAASKEMLESTLTNLDQWAREIRERDIDTGP